MEKISKLTKLKSAIKRLPSFTKIVRTNSSIAAANNDHDPYDQSNDHIDGKISKELHAVYVGKSKRRYLLSSDVICHPLFQGLIDRSGAGFGDEDNQAVVVVACEVVLFEHLLWMIESGGSQFGSMEELAEFYYTC